MKTHRLTASMDLPLVMQIRDVPHLAAPCLQGYGTTPHTIDSDQNIPSLAPSRLY